MRYFKKNWSTELQEEVLSLAETIVRPLIGSNYFVFNSNHDINIC